MTSAVALWQKSLPYAAKLLPSILVNERSEPNNTQLSDSKQSQSASKAARTVVLEAIARRNNASASHHHGDGIHIPQEQRVCIARGSQLAEGLRANRPSRRTSDVGGRARDGDLEIA